MATPSDPPSTDAVAVVGPQFCDPHPVDLTVTKEALRDGDFTVTDVNGNLVFQMRGILSFRSRRILLDAAGNPLISMQQKVMSPRSRWKVFRGDSSDDKDLLFSAKRSSIFQAKTKLHVFLAANTTEDACDFTVKGSYSERSSTVYLGNSASIIAQSNNKNTFKNFLRGKDTFGVTIYPHVDHAFVVALIVILYEVNISGAGAG